MSDSSNNYCVIDALCGIDTASPQISRFTEGFDSIKFLLGKNFDEYTMMIITDIDGHVEIVNTDGIRLTKETDEESGETFLMWKPERNITAESGVVIYQIAGFKSGSDNIESVWYSKEGRLMVTDSIDTTSYSASVMGAYPNLLTKLLIQSDEIRNMAETLEKSKVNSIDGMGLSENSYSNEEKEKLASIDTGANVNVQSDWNEDDEASDQFIKNKPLLKRIATSGNYSDLENTPVVDTEFDQESTNAQSGVAVAQAMAKLVDSAPETLNTLDELAAALGDDPNFATTIMTLLGEKANKKDLKPVATSGSYNDLSDTPEIPSIDGLATEEYVNGKLSDINLEIGILSDASAQHETVINNIKEDIQALDNSVAQLSEDLTATGSAVSENSERLDTIERKYVTSTSFSMVNATVQKHTTDINGLKEDVGDIETALDSIITMQNELMGVSE